MHFLPYLLNICRKFEFLISQGSVATCLRWGGYCRMGFVANFIHFPAVQKFWKSVKVWQSYREFKGGNFFETQCIYPVGPGFESRPTPVTRSSPARTVLSHRDRPGIAFSPKTISIRSDVLSKSTTVTDRQTDRQCCLSICRQNCEHVYLSMSILTLSSPVMPNGYISGPYWSNPQFLIFWHSGTLAVRTERQSRVAHGSIFKNPIQSNSLR